MNASTLDIGSKLKNEAWYYSKELYHLAPRPQYRRKIHYLALKTPAK